VLILGIDPGTTGCLCVLDTVRRDVEFHDTPFLEVKVGKTFKKEQNAAQIVLMLQSVTANQEALVFIEKVQAMPGGGERSMGATSSFNFGKGFGMWLGILAALQLPVHQIHPATWKAAMMRGVSKEKDASRGRAMELMPKSAKHLMLKKHHNRADALLLALYGERQNDFRALPSQKSSQIAETLFG
jgi:crossover junction endodeoxyribonuclease RuvC